ncbi:MAG TPA: hypothetical protein VNB23_01295 [Ramlibacter sp.]|nr:hypothetical protein [Ramlibacter sp.]
MASPRNIHLFHGLQAARVESACASPWLAAPLWLAIVTTAALWAFLGWQATLPATPPDAVPPDLVGIARPARFQPRTAPPGVAHVVSEPVTLLQSARVQQIVGRNGEYSINGRPFTAAAGMVWPGSVVRMRVRLAPGECEAQATLVVGGRSAVFRVEAGDGQPACRHLARQPPIALVESLPR